MLAETKQLQKLAGCEEAWPSLASQGPKDRKGDPL